MRGNRQSGVRRRLADYREIQEHCESLAFCVGHKPGEAGKELDPPPSPWVRAVVWVGLPALAVVAALLPWGIVAPPGLVVQAFPPAPSPQVTVPPREPRGDSYPQEVVRVPVSAPTAAPANPMPMPTPAVVQSDAPAPTPMPTLPVPVTTATPTPSPLPLPVPATPAATPAPEPTPKQCYRQVFMLCPPQG